MVEGIDGMRSAIAQKRAFWIGMGVALMLILAGVGATYSFVGTIYVLFAVFWLACWAVDRGGGGFGFDIPFKELWNNNAVIRRFWFTLALFFGAFVILGVGPSVFGDSWSSGIVLRAFSILIGEIVVVIVIWRIGGKVGKAQNCFEQAERYSNPSNKGFDLDRATHLLEEALGLEPDNKKYREKLDEIHDIKAKTFAMLITESALAVKFSTGAKGVRIKGRVLHGTIQSGDEVQIRGRSGIREATVFDVQGLVIPSKEVLLAIEGMIRTGDVRVGDVVGKE